MEQSQSRTGTDATADVSPPASAGRSILVVEDEEAIAQGLRDALEHAGCLVETVADGREAFNRIRAGSFDLVLLDLMLPTMNGLDILKNLRAEGHSTRVLILSALGDEEDLLKGFALGADDYMAKPFSPAELLARVEAQFRRRNMDHRPPEQFDLTPDIRVDLGRLEVHRDGELTSLTPREADILSYLIQHKDRVVTREDLLRDVWHYLNATIETRTVDIHIVGLRRKVEPNPATPTFIQTVRGRGYRWDQ
jgi:two-component system response regulator RegX3